MPAVSRKVVARSRVDSLILDLMDQFSVIRVTATAGSGKTTAVALALATLPGPVAWLTLDESDRAAGRLLQYLDRSIRAAVPGLPREWESLPSGMTHSDRAGLLAESLLDRRLVRPNRPLVVVFDELERIRDSTPALQTISSFLHYAPATLRIVLISREAVDLRLSREVVRGDIGDVGEPDLAFTVEEAAAALARVRSTDVDPTLAVEATRGWVAGVLFESWRSAEHVHGTGGEADPLHGYLSTEIMARLDKRSRDFLVVTSILDVVTQQRAERLGVQDAGKLIESLRGFHLPIDFIESSAIRCHPRFREYLASRRQLLPAPGQRRLSLAYAHLLVEEGRSEDALSEYLAAGDFDRAERLAEETILDVARRLDMAVVDQWLSALGTERVERSDRLMSARLLLALEREEYGRGARASDRLREMGTRLDSGLIGVMAWCYFLVGRIEDAYQVLGEAPTDKRIETMRYLIGVELIDDPTTYPDRPPDPPPEFDGMLSRLDLVHGRYLEILRHPNARGVIRLSQLGALSGLGRLEEAEQLASEISATGWTAVRLKAELMAECGLPEQAWAELIAGREELDRTESPLYRSFALLAEAMLALRFKKDTAQAAAALRAAESQATALSRTRVVEQLDLWRGLIALLDGDADLATERLSHAVELMRSAERWMLLPTAAVYLAEALWCDGREDESDAAADLALNIADKTGSRHSLLRALTEFPSVVSRRLDLEEDPDGPWHDLGRSLALGAKVRPSKPGCAWVRVVEVGRPGLELSGRRADPKLLKSIELLSYLSAEGGTAARERVLTDLFGSSSEKSANAYLRMSVNSIRASVGDRSCIEVGSERVTWTLGRLKSDFDDLETRLRRITHSQGSERLSLALEGLSRAAEGEFLPGARSDWADAQRRRWQEMILNTRYAAAEAAYQLADYPKAHYLTQDVLQDDPYRERAWRLAMRIASAVGDGDRVLSLYRACERSLAEIPAEPSPSTKRLLHDLRL